MKSPPFETGLRLFSATSERVSTFSVFGLIHLMKCGLAAFILSIRIPKEVYRMKNKYELQYLTPTNDSVSKYTKCQLNAVIQNKFWNEWCW